MITAHSPRFTSDGSITILATFPWFDGEVPFTASLVDGEEYGRDLYAQALAGDFGAVAPYVPPPAPPVVIPDVSPRQIRQALTAFGLRSQVEAAVALGNQDLKDWWEFSTSFERLNPQVTAMASIVGATGDQLDAIWAHAKGL